MMYVSCVGLVDTLMGARFRLMIATAVSVMGTPAAIMGTSNEMNSVDRAMASNETTPSASPSMRDPESPMKMEAGWWLFFKKPMQMPRMMMLSRAAS